MGFVKVKFEKFQITLNISLKKKKKITLKYHNLKFLLYFIQPEYQIIPYMFKNFHINPDKF